MNLTPEQIARASSATARILSQLRDEAGIAALDAEVCYLLQPAFRDGIAAFDPSTTVDAGNVVEFVREVLARYIVNGRAVPLTWDDHATASHRNYLDPWRARLVALLALPSTDHAHGVCDESTCGECAAFAAMTAEEMAKTAYPLNAVHLETPVELKRALYAQGVKAERDRIAAIRRVLTASTPTPIDPESGVREPADPTDERAPGLSLLASEPVEALPVGPVTRHTYYGCGCYERNGERIKSCYAHGGPVDPESGAREPIVSATTGEP